jgi:hypothetical protein
MKGFNEAPDLDLIQLLRSVKHSELRCPDRGYDIASYLYAADRIAEPLVFFINSFSVLGADRWLSKLHDAYRQERVGLVGATGSWESLSFNSISEDLPSAVRVALAVPLRLLFPAFPNAHLRTNGFMLSRRDFLRMRRSLMPTKLGAWMFESGRNSMTRQISKQGLHTLVVGKDGASYRPEDWAQSRTFWQSAQENLLIEDNRTAAYDLGDAEFKARRSKSAWNLQRTR